MADRCVPRVVVTGFGAFFENADNPTTHIIKALPFEELDGCFLVTRHLSVKYATVDSCVPKLWQAVEPDLVVHLGLHGGTSTMVLERCGYVGGHERPDISGCIPVDGLCKPTVSHQQCSGSASDVFETGFDLTQVAEECNQLCNHPLGVQFSISDDAGRFVCNYCYATSLQMDRMRSLFVHVPPIGRPFSLAQMTASVGVLLRVLLRHRLACPAPSTMPLSPPFFPYQRVRFAQRFATVHYVGGLVDHAGQWVGLEWDSEDKAQSASAAGADTSGTLSIAAAVHGGHLNSGTGSPDSGESGDNAGKSRGIVGDVQYVVCRHSLASAGFVRLESAQQKLNRGQHILQAVAVKYGHNDIQPVSDANAAVIQFGSKAVEFVDFDTAAKKMADIEKLGIVAVNAMDISDVSIESIYGSLVSEPARNPLRNCRELYLSRNLLSRWSALLRFLRDLPVLALLDVSDNMMLYDVNYDEQNSSSTAMAPLELPTVRMLIINNCYLWWHKAEQILRHFPSVTQLSVAFNCLRRQNCSAEAKFRPLTDCTATRRFAPVQTLSVEGNRLLWSDVIDLGNRFPSLISLNVNNCSLGDFHEDNLVQFEQLGRAFPHLLSVVLSNNNFAAMDTLAAFATVWPQLVDIVSHGQAFATSTWQTLRQEFIARFEHLKRVNHTDVDSVERKGAERDYLNRYAQHYARVCEAGQQTACCDFERRWPRYMQLCAIHGPPDIDRFLKPKAQAGVSSKDSPAPFTPAVVAAAGASTLQDQRLAQVFLRCGSKTLQRSLPLSTTIAKVRLLFGRVFPGEFSPNLSPREPGADGSSAPLRLYLLGNAGLTITRPGGANGAVAGHEAVAATSVLPDCPSSTQQAAPVRRILLDISTKTLGDYSIDPFDTISAEP